MKSATVLLMSDSLNNQENQGHYLVLTLCYVCGGHRSNCEYWKNRSGKPDGRRAVLRSQVLELHGIRHGLAGARSIATMATQHWLAGRFMKELGDWPVVSS